MGPFYGYQPNAAKTYLIIKLQLYVVQVTFHSQCHLGAAIGTRLFTEGYVSKKVKIWSDEILTLSSIAETHPHSTYWAFVNGVIPKWNYVM